MRENALQTKCIKYLKEQGIYFINIHGDGWGSKGSPDIIACIDGRFVAFELKVDKNQMQSDQQIHAIRIKRNKGLHYCPRTIHRFIAIIEAIKDGRLDG